MTRTTPMRQIQAATRVESGLRRSFASWAIRIACLLLVVAAAPASGQGITVGLKGGVNGSSLTDLDQTESRAGYVAGAYAQFGLSRAIFIQPELLYVSRRVRGTPDGETTQLQADFADLAALLGFRPISGSFSPFVYGGPILSFETRCRIEADSGLSATDCPDFDFDTNATQTFLAFGGGVDVALGALILTGDLRYQLGLSEAAKDDNAKWRSWSFVVGVGLGFGR